MNYNTDAHLGVFYDLVPHKKINGTMFYAFEYFVFLNNYKPTTLYINNITDEYLSEIKELFVERYKFNEDLLDLIIPITTIRDYITINKTLSKALFLDIRSFNNLHPFLKSDCVVYANDVGVVQANKNVTVFGWYYYQNFDVREKLKFNFDIFRAILPRKTDTAFVSAPDQDESIIEKLPIEESNVIFKPKNNSVTNLFESFDTLYYYHSRIDKNNRFIVEAMYFGKNVDITYTGEPKDSVYYRHKDIVKNGLRAYHLTDKDLLIKEVLR